MQKMKGFTLIELVLYMGLLAIFLTIVSSIFIQSLSIQLESEAVSSIEQDGRYLLTRMGYDVARASAINNPSVPGSTSADLQFVALGTTYTYSLVGGNLMHVASSASAQLNSYGTSVSGLQFTRKGNTGMNAKQTITVTFTLTSRTIREKGADVKVFSSTFGTR